MSAVATLAAVSTLVDLLTAVTSFTLKAQELSIILQKAHSEGREISDEELNSIITDTELARARLEAALRKDA